MSPEPLPFDAAGYVDVESLPGGDPDAVLEPDTVLELQDALRSDPTPELDDDSWRTLLDGVFEADVDDGLDHDVLDLTDPGQGVDDVGDLDLDAAGPFPVADDDGGFDDGLGLRRGGPDELAEPGSDAADPTGAGGLEPGLDDPSVDKGDASGAVDLDGADDLHDGELGLVGDADLDDPLVDLGRSDDVDGGFDDGFDEPDDDLDDGFDGLDDGDLGANGG